MNEEEVIYIDNLKIFAIRKCVCNFYIATPSYYGEKNINDILYDHLSKTMDEFCKQRNISLADLSLSMVEK